MTEIVDFSLSNVAKLKFAHFCESKIHQNTFVHSIFGQISNFNNFEGSFEPYLGVQIFRS